MPGYPFIISISLVLDVLHSELRYIKIRKEDSKLSLFSNMIAIKNPREP